MASLLLAIASGVCLVVAVLVAIGVVTGDYRAWLAGGLLAFVLSVLAPIRAGVGQ